MVLRIKKIVFLIITMQAIAYSDSIYSLLDIHKLRSNKLNQDRDYHGKKILKQRFHNKSPLLINRATEMAALLGCDKNMRQAQRKVIGNTQKYNIVISACEIKSREK